jgi:hypothetical protein
MRAIAQMESGKIVYKILYTATINRFHEAISSLVSDRSFQARLVYDLQKLSNIPTIVCALSMCLSIHIYII